MGWVTLWLYCIAHELEDAERLRKGLVLGHAVAVQVGQLGVPIEPPARKPGQAVVLVLDAGEVVAFDSPHKLSLQEDGVFAAMIDDTGKGMANELRRRASRASLVGLADTS